MPGPRNGAENCTTLQEFWNILFDEEMRNMIVDCTNKQIEDVCSHLMANGVVMQTYHHTTDSTEFNAFIGLLYYSGLWKSIHVNADELWSHTNGNNLYRCVMPKNRFVFLANCLRFDIRENRSADDRLAPIRELWEKFIAHCEYYYNPSDKLTVDEQLLSFRGRCKFRMYMKSKPDKYGLKIITLNDANTFYLVSYFTFICYLYVACYEKCNITKLLFSFQINAIPYLGKSGHAANESSEFFFKKVTTPIHGTNRSVTCDNWFTSVPLLIEMSKEPYLMQLTGTIRKNKPDIPNEFKLASKTVPHSKFCHSENVTLVCLKNTRLKNTKLFY